MICIYITPSLSCIFVTENRGIMKIDIFTEEDIREAALLAYPVWGEEHAANGQGKEFGLLMCE